VRKGSAYTRNIIAVLGVSFLLIGCGGGGSSSDVSSVTPSTGKVLRWNAPVSYSDQTPLNPVTDLKEYLIFINDDGNFSSSDSPSAVAAAVDPLTGKPMESFNLSNLTGFLNPGVTYYISMQSVSVTGAKSDFSPPAAFSL
jgi:hypothetical protein